MRARVEIEPEAMRFWNESGDWDAEASTLGLSPGEWPAVIVVALPEGPLTFLRCERIPSGDGDLVGWCYRTTDRSITVWND
ncbi:MAG: hypothetical protein ACRD1P_07335 [Thermoanaerobaculia bacterium]